MDTIDDLVENDQHVDTIEDLSASLPIQSFKPLPQSATNNQSAVLSVLSDDATKVIDNYRGMQTEAILGNTSLADSIRRQAQEKTREAAFQNGILPLLYDPLADIEVKQKALDDFNSSVANPDSISMLASEALISDSKGESIDSEEARISLADDLFTNFQESYKLEQQAINNFKLSLQENATGIGMTVDLAQEIMIPVAEGIKTYSFVTELNRRLNQSTVFEKKVKAFLRPGASMEEIREQYQTLSGNDRLVFVQTVIDTIKDTQGVIFSSDSQFSAIDMLEKVVGEYSPAEATWDTVANALDIFGIGLLARGATKAFRTPREAATATVEANKGATPASVDNPDVSPLDVPTDIQMKVANPEKTKLDGLYQQKAELIADSSQVLPARSVDNLNTELVQINQSIEGAKSSFSAEVKSLQIRKQMTRKDAESAIRKMQNDAFQDLNARKQRIEDLLDMNRKGQKSQDKIKTLETEIDRIENLPDADGVVRVNPLSDAINRIDRNSLVGIENTASVGSIFYKTNPDKARTALKAVFDSAGDEVAMALYGASKQDVLGNAIMPKQVTASGKISARPVNVAGKIEKPEMMLADEIGEVVKDARNVELTPREKELGATKIINDFKSPTRIRVFDGMDGFHVAHDDGLVKISSVYGTERGAFSDAEEALTQAKLALREYGDLTPYMTVMKKDGVNYTPVKLADVKGKKGDYLVKVEFSRKIDKSDVAAQGIFDEFKLKWNWLDSVPALTSEQSGTWTRRIFSSGAIFDKHLTTAANVVDALNSRLEKILQRKVRQIVTDIKKLPKQDQERISAYFVEANDRGIPFTASDMAMRGFTTPMQQIVKNWRDYWDNVYDLQNVDMVKTLKSQGYQLLDNGSDRFFARPINKNIREAKGYDPESGTIVVMSRKEMDDLYEQGGTIAELKTTFNFNGEDVTNLIIKNNSNSFLRGLVDTDKALNYREGYFQTSYRAPLFIDKTDPKTGKTVAIATAKDRLEADLFIKRQQQENPNFEYNTRPDKKTLPDQKEDVWNLNDQGGVTAQRRRGQPLIEADGSNRLEGSAYFDSPIESAVRASRSIAGRAIYRDLIETMKARAMQKHGHLFPKSEGVTQFPSKISDITSKSGPYGKDVRDARTDFEYIHYLENGYMNGLDNAFKMLMGFFANQAGTIAAKTGSKTAAAAERALHVVEQTPVTGIGKATVFNAYIATNVFRQWIVQPAQLFRLGAYDVAGLPNTLRLAYDYTHFLATGKAATKQGQGFSTFMERSGILDSVDKSSLVRGTLMTSGEQATWWAKTGGRITEPLRVVGYDLGEKANLIGHMAAVYGKYVREGKAVGTKAVQEEMIGKARALSYDMGFTGDMPYNQNWMAIFTQFMQVPHKAVLQGFDRRLTPGERARMVIGDALIYGAIGTPVVMAANALFGEQFLDENPELKSWIVDGALQKGGNMILKTALQGLGGEGPSNELDLSGSLSPFEFGGYVKMAEALLQDGGLMDALSNTPAGGLLLKDGNRVQKAIMSVGRMVGFVDDSELNPQTVMSTLNDVASVTSGWNNIQKAIMAKEMNKIITKTGQTLVNGVNTADAVAIALGIQPTEVGKFYENAMYVAEETKAYEDAVRQSVKTAIEVAVGRTQVGVDDASTREIVNGILMKAYRGSPRAMQIINQEMGFALQDPQMKLQEAALNAMSLPELELDREKMKRMIPADKWELVDKWHNDINASLQALEIEE